MCPTPYIGITGFMSKAEVELIMNSVPQNTDRLIMIGVLMSQKTFNGQATESKRYPLKEETPKIFYQHPKALNLVHYNTQEPETLYYQLCDIKGFFQIQHESSLDGFQLNIAWPDPRQIESFRKIGHTTIVLQIESHALEMIEHSPTKLAEKIKQEYEGLVDYVLLDPSGGLGLPFDPGKAKMYLDAIKSKEININLGVAGGLSAETLTLLEPLSEYFKELSIDAEGKLRDANDNLHLLKAMQYLKRSLELLGE